MSDKITAYKGFNKDMTCRSFQFERGKEYTHDGQVRACEGGFHACEYPLDVLAYYAPAESVFAVVEQSGDMSRCGEDSKVASRTIKIGAQIDIAGLVKAAIEYTASRCDPKKSNSTKAPKSLASNSGHRGAASNSGYSGAASNSGHRGAASNSGYRGAASNSGHSGAASNSGHRGAASNSGHRGAASNSGKHGVAADFSGTGKAMSGETGAIVCVCRDDDGRILHIRASKVGENGIKPNVWYFLDESGEFVEVG